MRYTVIAAIIGVTTAAVAPAVAQEARDLALIPTVPRFGEFEVGVRAEAARDALFAGDYASARRGFDAITSNTTLFNPDTLFLAGLADAGVNDLGRARSRFEQALVQDHGHIGARTALALTLVSLGKRTAAQRHLRVLATRQQRCAGTCTKAATLDAAVISVRRALA